MRRGAPQPAGIGTRSLVAGGLSYARAMALPEHLKKLLADVDVETYRGSGPGGQHRNKTESAVRMTHRPSGLVRVATEHRSQLRNRELALERIWRALEARRRRPKPRIATRPSKAAKERRLAGKQRDAAKKRMRGQPPAED